jgi:GGDEF domain-containing protein
MTHTIKRERHDEILWRAGQSSPCKTSPNSGDRVVVETTARLRKALHDEETLARLAGDEFAIIVRCTGDSAARTAAQIIEALKTPLLTCPVFRTTGLEHFRGVDELYS